MDAPGRPGYAFGSDLRFSLSHLCTTIIGMAPTERPVLKVCCIASVDEARLAIRYGASAIGLVAKMPSGPGVIEEALITQIAAAVPPALGTFLLTSEQHVDAII